MQKLAEMTNSLRLILVVTNMRLNKCGTCRITGLKVKELEKILAEMREILGNDLYE